MADLRTPQATAEPEKDYPLIPFDEFKKKLGALVAVPKEELDEQLAEYERNKPEKPRRKK